MGSRHCMLPKKRTLIEQPFDCIVRLGGNAAVEATSDDGRMPLHHAAAIAHVEKIKALCGVGAKVDALDSYRRTPLHHLCSWRGWDVEELAECLQLLKIKDLNAKDCKGRTSAHYAAGKGLIAALNYLRSAGAKLDERDNRGRAPSYYAARNGSFEAFKYLHESGVDVKKDVNTEDEHKKTPLHHATEKNDTEALRWLHQLGANMYAQDEEYYTCLHYVTKHRYSEAFDCLLSLGISIRAIIEGEKVKDNKYPPPVHLLHYLAEGALSRHPAASAEAFIRMGADLEARDKGGETPLHHAARTPNLEMIKFFLEHGAHIEATDDKEETPLHKAVRCGDSEVIRYFHTRGADFYAQDKEGQTAFHVAVEVAHERGDKQIIACLEALGIDIKIVIESEKRKSPSRYLLHHAASCGNIALIIRLHSFGASLECRDGWNRTPLHYAGLYGGIDTVKCLVRLGADIEAADKGGKTILSFMDLEEAEELKAIVQSRKQVANTQNVKPQEAEKDSGAT